jgi:aromatic-L-amino-acid decarboxylase
MRRLVEAATARIVAHLESLPRQPATGVESDEGEALARSLVEPIPERPEPAEAVLDLLFDRLVPVSFNTAGPGYLAYIPGGGVFHAALADFIADATNRYVGVWQAAPGLAQLEANVLRWFCDLVGYPGAARGILTSGGSLANFSAVVVARRERLPEDFLRGTIYTSDQAHHSVVKAAMLAGVPAANVRVLPTDATFRLRLDALEQALAQDRASGYTPFLVVGSAGTTNTGAVDDLTALADIAEREELWFHADAAYGGFFMMTEEGRRVLAGLERADSITLDPHKGLFLPYGTGSLLVKDGAALKRAHAIGAEYLPRLQEDDEFVDFCQYSPELSRPFRGLRVWLPFKLVGAGAFRESLAEKLDLARLAAGALRETPGVEIVAEPQLSIVAFRLRDPGKSEEELNELNRRFLDRINGRRRVYLTATTVAGRFILRICVLSFRTHRDRMEEGLDDIREAVAEIRR